VCSLAVFDFDRHGNSKYGAPIHAAKKLRSKQVIQLTDIAVLQLLLLVPVKLCIRQQVWCCRSGGGCLSWLVLQQCGSA